MKRHIFTVGGGIILLCTGMLSACTTVDLSQVSMDQKPIASVKPIQNVVEKAAISMAAMFTRKGWCAVSTTQSQSTANMLLNGIESKPSQATLHADVILSSRQLSDDLILAQEQVNQTTKAAEIFLTMSEKVSSFDKELSLLETALLSAREAEGNFQTMLGLVANQKNHQHYKEFQNSVDQLKLITDAYGDRIRHQISARANRSQS